MKPTLKWVIAGCALAGIAAALVALRGQAASDAETALSRAERLLQQAQLRVTEMQASLEAVRQVVTAVTAPEVAG